MHPAQAISSVLSSHLSPVSCNSCTCNTVIIQGTRSYLLWVSSINASLSAGGSGQRRCRSSAPPLHSAPSSHITDAASFLLSLRHRQLHPHLLLQRPPFYLPPPSPFPWSQIPHRPPPIPPQRSHLSPAAAAAEAAERSKNLLFLQ